MACSKYTLTNTGTTTVNFNYRRCDDSMWEYQVSLDPNQTKNIWLINGTYDTAQVYESSIVLVNDGAYPLTPTPTRTQTSTPTPTGTPNPTTTPTGTPNPTPTPTVTNTPTNTSSPTPTVTNTPTNTNSQTPTLTPTNTVTPTITPTNTETPTNTPTNTVTPSITPTNTPTPSATPTIEYIQLANTTWTGFTQQDFQNWLISGGTIPNVNNNPNAVVTAFNNTSGDITASIYNVTNINILQQTSFTGVTQLPDSLTSFNASFVNLPSLPTLSATSLTNLVLNYNTVITTLPELPSTISTLQIAGALNLTSLPELSGTSLQYLLAYNTQLSSLSSLPGSLTILDIHDCSFTTSTLDDAALSFIGSGSLPKTYWASGNQSTGDQPSSGVQTQLTTNVTTVDL